MRYLYRGKAKRVEGREYVTNYQNGDWVYGLVGDINETYGIAKMTNEQGVFGIEVDSNTIGQYTAQNDMNGKKIFEGDIVRYNDETFLVMFEQRNGSAYFGIKISNNETWGFSNSIPSSMMEIVGNIYDNPEMLKEVD